MKNIKTYIAIFGLLTLPFLNFADPPLPPIPPPPGGGGPGGGGTPVGAPIDGGLGILIALGLGYGGMKLYQVRKENEGIDEEKENSTY